MLRWCVRGFFLLRFPVTPSNRVSSCDNTTPISSCLLWLDGADSAVQFIDTTGVTPVTKGSQALVKFWRDKSIKSNHVLAYDTTTPTQYYSPGLINGRDALRSKEALNSTNSGLAFTFQGTHRPLSGKTSFTAFTVLNPSDQNQNMIPLQAQSNDISWLGKGNTIECLGCPWNVRITAPCVMNYGLCIYSTRGSSAAGTTSLAVNGTENVM